MAHHPLGVTITLCGLYKGDSVRSCAEHPQCGYALHIDAVVRLRKMQIETGPGQEGIVIAAWWIHDGVDMCCVGYAEDKFLGHLDQLHGRICQVVELFHFSEDQDKKQKSMDKDGVCEVVLIDEPRPNDSRLNDIE